VPSIHATAMHSTSATTTPAATTIEKHEQLQCN